MRNMYFWFQTHRRFPVKSHDDRVGRQHEGVFCSLEDVTLVSADGHVIPYRKKLP